MRLVIATILVLASVAWVAFLFQPAVASDARARIAMIEDAPSKWLDYASGSVRSGPKLIFVTQEACLPCEALLKRLESMDLTAFVCIKVNATYQPELAAALQSTRFPHVLVYEANGNLKSSYIGDDVICPEGSLRYPVEPVQYTQPVRYVPTSGC